MKERHRIICAAYLILKRDSQVLLLRRFNTGFEDGKYSVPAGHVEADESVLSCLVRETKEEIGIDIRPENTRLAHVLHRNRTPTNDARIDFFFECVSWSGEVKNLEPEKCDDLHWAALNALPDKVIPYIKQALLDAAEGVPYRELYWPS